MSQPPKLNKVVSFKVTPEQARLLRRAAKQRGMHFGQWMREHLVADAARELGQNGTPAHYRRLEVPQVP